MSEYVLTLFISGLIWVGSLLLLLKGLHIFKENKAKYPNKDRKNVYGCLFAWIAFSAFIAIDAVVIKKAVITISVVTLSMAISLHTWSTTVKFSA